MGSRDAGDIRPPTLSGLAADHRKQFPSGWEPIAPKEERKQRLEEANRFHVANQERHRYLRRVSRVSRVSRVLTGPKTKLR